jgi:aliphatic sulfonates family ABC transporter substrate-binding protein
VAQRSDDRPDRRSHAAARALVFADPASQALLTRLSHVARSEAVITLLGEPGTGKELYARHLHALTRSAGPFVAFDCGAAPERAVERALFGSEHDTLTRSAFDAAAGGTLYLDGPAALGASAQARLVRALERRRAERVGGTHERAFDVRVIAASHVDLGATRAAGRLMPALYYLLCAAPVHVPPLRERRADIVPLAQSLLLGLCTRRGLAEVTLSPAAASRLTCYRWPGNVRELARVLEQALLECGGSELDADALPLLDGALTPARALEPLFRGLFEAQVPDLRAEVERQLFRAAYAHAGTNQQETARLLGTTRHVVRARLLAEGVHVPRPRRPRRRRVRIGHQRFGLLGALAASGQLEARFADHGAVVEWCTFNSGLDVITALLHDELALGVVGEGPSVLAQATPSGLAYVAAEASAPEAEAIVAPPGSPLRSVGDLRGRCVAVQRGANAHYLLLCALREAGVGLHEVRVLELAPAAAREAFAQGEVDAWAIWDPWLAGLERAGAHVLRDGRGLALNPAYHLAAQRFADEAPELVNVFVEALSATAEWVRDHPAEAAALLAERSGWEVDVVSRSLSRKLAARVDSAALLPSQQAVADAFHDAAVLPCAIELSGARCFTHAFGGRSLLVAPVGTQGFVTQTS